MFDEIFWKHTRTTPALACCPGHSDPSFSKTTDSVFAKYTNVIYFIFSCAAQLKKQLSFLGGYIWMNVNKSNCYRFLKMTKR